MDAVQAFLARYRKGIVAALGALFLFLNEADATFVADLTTEVIGILTAAGVVAVPNAQVHDETMDRSPDDDGKTTLGTKV